VSTGGSDWVVDYNIYGVDLLGVVHAVGQTLMGTRYIVCDRTRSFTSKKDAHVTCQMCAIHEVMES